MPRGGEEMVMRVVAQGSDMAEKRHPFRAPQGDCPRSIDVPSGVKDGACCGNSRIPCQCESRLLDMPAILSILRGAIGKLDIEEWQTGRCRITNDLNFGERFAQGSMCRGGVRISEDEDRRHLVGQACIAIPEACFCGELP